MTSGLIAAFLIGGILGLTAHFRQGGNNDRYVPPAVTPIDVAGLYRSQDAELEQIPAEVCSAEWVRVTSEINLKYLQRVVTLWNADAFLAESKAYLTTYCADGDLKAFCERSAVSLTTWAFGDVGTKEDAMRGCLNRAGATPASP